MNGLLVRAGIDQEAGRWNGPVDPRSAEFVYVPRPETAEDSVRVRPQYRRSYQEIVQALGRMGVALPRHLNDDCMHLDPDFEHLTYGDKRKKAQRIGGLVDGDMIGFYAGLRPTVPGPDPLLYALIGVYFVREIVPATLVPRALWHENAHTRREPFDDEIIVRAKESTSGRLERCIPIGEYRNRAYRVRHPMLEAWAGLSVNDGWIQRSAVPPSFNDCDRFLHWLNGQGVPLVRRNNP